MAAAVPRNQGRVHSATIGQGGGGENEGVSGRSHRLPLRKKEVQSPGFRLGERETQSARAEASSGFVAALMNII